MAAFARHDARPRSSTLHTAPTYRVFMLGFVPRLRLPGHRRRADRRAAARRRRASACRAARSAIAGVQTGIYPAETPGGWQLIGRTPVQPFDLDARASRFC